MANNRPTSHRQCSICRHADRPAIDLALAQGLVIRAVARRFSVSRDALWRHKTGHLTPELRAALSLRLIAREGDARLAVLEENASTAQGIQAVRAPLFGMYLRAIDCNDTRAAASLAGRLLQSFEISAKITGELAASTSVTVNSLVLSTDYVRLRGELLNVLSRFPEAKEAVAAAFRKFGQEAATQMVRSAPRMIEGSAMTVEMSDAV
jgi:hypothetical protein